MRPVVYQLFVRHFSNFTEASTPWGSREENGCGTFNAINDGALEALARMGVTHLWLTGVLRHATQSEHEGLPADPVSVVKGVAGSPYAVKDYFDVDPDLAEDVPHRLDEFRALLSRCRRWGMVPMIDFIPNHVSRCYASTVCPDQAFGRGDNTAAFFSRDNTFYYLEPCNSDTPLMLPAGEFSPERGHGRVTGNNAATWSPGAFDWYETVKLNYGSDYRHGPYAADALPGVLAPYSAVPRTWLVMDAVLAYWQEMGVGGFRCDMAHMVPMPFWQWVIANSRLRDASVFFMAEAYNDHMKLTPRDVHEALIDAGFGGVYHADAYAALRALYEGGTWANDLDRFNKAETATFRKGVRYLENHDEPRLASPMFWGGKGEAAARALMVAQYTATAAPVLFYNGQEAAERAEGPGGYGGDNGRTSIFDYTCLPRLQHWTNGGRYDGAGMSAPEKELRSFCARLLPLLQHPALSSGGFYGLNWSNMASDGFGQLPGENVAGHMGYAFLRHNRKARATVLVVCNFDTEHAMETTLHVPLNAQQWAGKKPGRYSFVNLLDPAAAPLSATDAELESPGLPVCVPAGGALVLEWELTWLAHCAILLSMRVLLLLCALLCLYTTALAESTPKAFPADGANYGRFKMDKPPLLPKPQKVKWKGQALELTQSTGRFSASSLSETERKDAKFAQINKELAQFLSAHEVATAPQSFSFRVKKGLPKLPAGAKAWQKDEAYGIEVTAKGVIVTTNGTRGLYNALQTLKQLIVRRKGKTTIAECTIADWPDLQIRGFMNDTGRNYMPLDLIKQEINQMALLKLNTYHFHCCDNNGWRMQSRLYPKLNAKENMDRMPGKFYTHAEFRELVEYCRVRNITVIPEMDMPGHSATFRKALDVSSMKDPKATAALVKLIGELAAQVPADRMPYIHIGTDEVRSEAEKVDAETLAQYFEAVEKAGRTPIRWQPGMNPPGYTGAIQQIWMGRGARHSWPTKGARYLDSHDSYVNHLDPFETACMFYFRRPCPFKFAEGMGFILCSWPDLPIDDPRNQVWHTPIYSAMAFCSESVWHNPHEPIGDDPSQDELLPYFSNLPKQGTDLIKGFAECEDRVLAIRDRFFVNREFNYVRQADCPWKLIGPFPHGGNVERSFGPESILKTGKVEESYTEDGTEYRWHEGEYSGHTILFKQYCDYPTPFNNGGYGFPHKDCTYYALQYIYSPKNQKVPFWVSGHTWATSDWRNGPVSVPGEWFHAKPKFWVNGKKIEAPKWKKPGNNGAMVDENYHFREPTLIELKKGWNMVLIKSPNNSKTRRWMFTFAPVKVNPKTPGCNVREFPGLKFATSPSPK